MSRNILIIEDDKGLKEGIRLALKKEYDGFYLLITVNNMESDIVLGLETGANEYVTKPFSLMVLKIVSFHAKKNFICEA